MERLGTLIVLAVTASGLVGCALCAAPFDYDYPAYGGRIERLDRQHGRVGSAFTPGVGHPANPMAAEPDVEWLPESPAQKEPAGSTPQDEDPINPPEGSGDWNDSEDWDFEPRPAEPSPMDAPPRGQAPRLEDAPLFEDSMPPDDTFDAVDNTTAHERAAALQTSLLWEFPSEQPRDGDVALVGILTGENDDQRAE